ncbi:Gp49 family protein [Pseudomonas nicosulfuronedens]|uniref:Gp49 family protein n=1 Tax=Pseudomonas nicosulfuronedens TaxID=2571105 RepID=UPI0024497693|nr:Gp49 family protein [Pseudomonas nicosulfuronedens]MDH1010002.1 Gp49 family protein [Pseudomonas nicosulfuronedens]MDH1978978.1 Gp49 family protein [Pseudomonas nicosulfuronedens]MDH2028343.1 Gp49 family protein [Pseudomonas nicosulfuronedens]
MTDSIEQEIQAKGLTAPRITPADIEAAISSVHYFIASDAIQHDLAVHECGPEGWRLASTQLLTICVLQLRNGFTVTGESACASPENFDAEIGRKIARQNAVQKVWPLEGYLLRDRLHQRALLEAEPKTGRGAQE